MNTLFFRRFFISLFSAFTLLFIVGAIYQNIETNKDSVQFPMPGKLIEVDGIKLHINCTGPNSGVNNFNSVGPTIVLIPGMGSVSTSWENVQKPLSENWNTCSYDRDGLAWSEESGEPRDVGIAVRRLQLLLHKSDALKPYIMVGHSYGGMVARVYADEYPEEVSGMVLVDSAHQDMGERFSPEARSAFKMLLRSFYFSYIAHHTGVLRFSNFMAASIDGLDGIAWEASMAQLNTTHHLYGSAQEANGWEKSAERAREVKGFSNLPLAVLVALDWPDFMLADWKVMQNELSTLSTQSKLQFYEGASHSKIAMDPGYALQVTTQIEEIVKQRHEPQ